MLERIIQLRDRSWGWFSARAHSKHALFWLIVISFTEPIFSFIVPETLLVAMLLVKSERWRFYSWVTTITSTLGGVAGYFIGALLFNSVGAYLIHLYGLESFVMEARTLIGAHIFLTMFLVSFSPLPDKVFVLTAGFLGSAFVPYLAGYVAGRGLRFFLVAYLVHRFGTRVLALMNKYFPYVALISALIIGLLILEVATGTHIG